MRQAGSGIQLRTVLCVKASSQRPLAIVTRRINRLHLIHGPLHAEAVPTIATAFGSPFSSGHHDCETDKYGPIRSCIYCMPAVARSPK